MTEQRYSGKNEGMKTSRIITPALFSVLLSLAFVIPTLSAMAQQSLDASYVIETFPAGGSPHYLASDGANIWATNGGTAVTKLRASDGVILGTFTVGNGGSHIAFDGANIWVANILDWTVSKLRASDGARLGTFDVAANPIGIAWDGANIWVASGNKRVITKLRGSDGAVLGIFPVGYGAGDVFFDRENIWVAALDDQGVDKLLPSDGALLGKVRTRIEPGGFRVRRDETVGHQPRHQHRHCRGCEKWQSGGNFPGRSWRVHRRLRWR